MAVSDIATGRRVLLAEPEGGWSSTAASFSPDGTFILTYGGADAFMRLWDAVSGVEVASLQDLEVQTQFSPEGNVFARTRRTWSASGSPAVLYGSVPSPDRFDISTLVYKI